MLLLLPLVLSYFWKFFEATLLCPGTAGGLCLALRKTGFLSARPQVPPHPGAQETRLWVEGWRSPLWGPCLYSAAPSDCSVQTLGSSGAAGTDKAEPLSVKCSLGEEINHLHFCYISSGSSKRPSPLVSCPLWSSTVNYSPWFLSHDMLVPI